MSFGGTDQPISKSTAVPQRAVKKKCSETSTGALTQKLSHLALQNKRLLYGTLLRAASETLLTIAQDPRRLGARIAFLMIVYSKPPFGSPELALKYLARYTHRVAISNGRLLAIKDGTVAFRWKDYAHQGRQRTMTLKAVDFIRRFLLHVLPKRFVHIRSYGLMANRSRKKQSG